MAVIAFPVPQADFGDQLPVQVVDWDLKLYQEMSIAGNGEFQTKDLAPGLWEGNVTLRPMLHTVARGWKARLNALDGMHTFYLANPLGWWPAADPNGTIYAASAPAIGTIGGNRKELTFTGLPGGYVLSSGDFFHVAYAGGTRRGLFQIVTGGNASVGGITPSLEVRPHLQAGITDGMAVSFKRPSAKVKLITGTADISFHNANRDRITFSVRQTLQAGN